MVLANSAALAYQLTYAYSLTPYLNLPLCTLRRCTRDIQNPYHLAEATFGSSIASTFLMSSCAWQAMLATKLLLIAQVDQQCSRGWHSSTWLGWFQLRQLYTNFGNVVLSSDSHTCQAHALSQLSVIYRYSAQTTMYIWRKSLSMIFSGVLHVTRGHNLFMFFGRWWLNWLLVDGWTDCLLIRSLCL